MKIDMSDGNLKIDTANEKMSMIITEKRLKNKDDIE